jgi:hypothetical protein
MNDINHETQLESYHFQFSAHALDFFDNLQHTNSTRINWNRKIGLVVRFGGEDIKLTVMAVKSDMACKNTPWMIENRASASFKSSLNISSVSLRAAGLRDVDFGNMKRMKMGFISKQLVSMEYGIAVLRVIFQDNSEVL